jgi:hypothetical protein
MMTTVSRQNPEEPTFQFATTIDVKNDLQAVSDGDPGQRHKKQLLRLQDLLAGTMVDPSAFRKYEYGGQRRCLFNVVVALEWSPSSAYLEVLKDAFRQASLLLLDVTDGYMAIGQVAIGGPEFMACADIQIFASNRLFPRASVSGMNDPAKYQPIRLGRGLWSKNRRTIIPWNDRQGYATLVHEWGHYALGLKDQYLTLDRHSHHVTPNLSLVKNTIMANLEKSELLGPRPNRQANAEDSEWEALRVQSRFVWLNIEPHDPDPNPPAEIVIPEVRPIGSAANDGQELLFNPSGASVSDRAIDLAHCWVYVVKGSLDQPTELLAQGSFERTGDFRLLGAAQGDIVVVIGDQQGQPGRPIVLWAKIEAVADDNAVMGSWYDATPEPFPIVDVTATNASTAPPFGVRVSGFDPETWAATLFPLGRQPTPANAPVKNLDVLDGHILLVSNGGSEPKLAIASYAQGGSPFSGYPGHPNPIPAGSADGNAMVFFYDESDEKLSYKQIHLGAGKPPAGQPFTGSNIITTTNLENDTPSPDGWEPRSYTFSITAHSSLDKVAGLNPTIVLYFDEETLQNTNGQLFIAGYNPQANRRWVRLDDSIVKAEDYFVSASLLPNTAAQGLFEPAPQPVHFRLFLEPASSAE